MSKAEITIFEKAINYVHNRDLHSDDKSTLGNGVFPTNLLTTEEIVGSTAIHEETHVTDKSSNPVLSKTGTGQQLEINTHIK